MTTVNYTLTLGEELKNGQEFFYDYIGESVRDNIEDALMVADRSCEFTYKLEQEGRDDLSGHLKLHSEDGYDYIGESLRDDLEDNLDYTKDFKLTYTLSY